MPLLPDPVAAPAGTEADPAVALAGIRGSCVEAGVGERESCLLGSIRARMVARTTRVVGGRKSHRFRRIVRISGPFRRCEIDALGRAWRLTSFLTPPGPPR